MSSQKNSYLKINSLHMYCCRAYAIWSLGAYAQVSTLRVFSFYLIFLLFSHLSLRVQQLLALAFIKVDCKLYINLNPVIAITVFLLLVKDLSKENALKANKTQYLLFLNFVSTGRLASSSLSWMNCPRGVKAFFKSQRLASAG